MIVELLHFRVHSGMRQSFIERNERIWTPALRERPGFLGREILIRHDFPDEVLLLVRWRSRADLDAFPPELERRLDVEMADLVEGREMGVYDDIDLMER